MPTEHIIALLVAERDKLNAQLKRSRVPSKDVAGFEESVHCCARADYHARKEAQKRKVRRCAQGPIPTYEGVLGE